MKLCQALPFPSLPVPVPNLSFPHGSNGRTPRAPWRRRCPNGPATALLPALCFPTSRTLLKDETTAPRRPARWPPKAILRAGHGGVVGGSHFHEHRNRTLGNLPVILRARCPSRLALVEISARSAVEGHGRPDLILYKYASFRIRACSCT